jgi:quinol monooxygenase YgiN
MRKSDIEVVCVAEFISKDGKENELLSSLHSLMAPTHKEDGCIRYELNQSINNPKVITFIEKFKSREAFDLHCSMDYIVNYFENTAPNLVESQKITLYKEILP